MAIESYRFGHLVLDGKSYDADLLILPERVVDHWWRIEGHRLSPADLEEVVQAKPEVLVIGTGAMGRMEVPPETLRYLEEHGIRALVELSAHACERFNALAAAGKRVAAALHLTC